jgi:uroporphyrinogen decarboxylase
MGIKILRERNVNYRDSDKNRFLRTIQWEPTDRIPNLETLFESRHVDSILHKRLGKNSWEIAPADQVELALRTGIDMLFVGGYGKFGQQYKTMDDGSNQYVDGTIKNRRDLAHWDFAFDFRKRLGKFENDLRNLVHETRKTKVGVAVAIRSVFADSTLSMGTLDFMLSLYDDPELIVKMMDLYLDFALRIIEIISWYPVDLVLIDDDLADSHGLMIGEAKIRELWLPRTKIIVEKLNSHGLPYIGHCCGKLDEVIPMLIELGYLAVHPIQPTCNDIYVLRAQYGRRIAFIGNIDILETLSLGSEEKVRKEVLEHLTRLGKDGGYVLSSSHTMVNSVAVSNYEAMLKTLREFTSDKSPSRRNE